MTDQTADRRERYAEALYNTLEVSPARHPWETLSPLRRAVWYARADAAMKLADEARAATPAGPAPATDRKTRRDRIAEALLDHLSRTADIRPGRSGDLAFMPEVTDAERLRIAEHLAAVLPAPDQRAAVLLEAADDLDRYVGKQSSDAAPEVYGARMVIRELRRLAGEAQQDERCTRCTHPKRDHDGRADHREKYTPVVAGEPWCHACNTECDYEPAREAQQDPTQDGDPGAALARHINAQRISVIQRAFRMLGWGPLRFELREDPNAAVARPGQPDTDGAPR